MSRLKREFNLRVCNTMFEEPKSRYVLGINLLNATKAKDSDSFSMIYKNFKL